MASLYQEKQPVVYDVSQDDLGALLISPAPYGVYARASVARWVDAAHTWQFLDVIRDASLPVVWEDSRKRGYRFGPFHYTLQGGIAEQAKRFTDVLTENHISEQGRWNAEFPPCLDVEIECTGKALIGKAYADMLKEWIDRVEQIVQTQVAIYTARPQWAYVLQNGRAPDWIQGRLLWCKWYPYDDYIDRNATLPASVLPAGWTIDQLIAWQYAQYGRKFGFRCNDQNVITEAGRKLFDAKIPNIPAPETPPATITLPLPPEGQVTLLHSNGQHWTGLPEVIMTPSYYPPLPAPVPGPTPEPTPTPAPEPVPEPAGDAFVIEKTISLTRTRLDGSTFTDNVTYHALVYDPKIYELLVDDSLSVTYPHLWGLKKNCEYVTNGGAGWNSITILKKRILTYIYGQSISQGKGFGSLDKNWGQVYVDPDGRMDLQRPKNVYTTFPFTNLLIYNNTLPVINKQIDYRARTAVGERADGKNVLLVVDGGDYFETHGMSFQEVAQVLHEDLACVFGVMQDGGGSSFFAKLLDGIVSILSKNTAAEDAVTVNGAVIKIRPTAGHMGIRRRG